MEFFNSFYEFLFIKFLPFFGQLNERCARQIKTINKIIEFKGRIKTAAKNVNREEERIEIETIKYISIIFSTCILRRKVKGNNLFNQFNDFRFFRKFSNRRRVFLLCFHPCSCCYCYNALMGSQSMMSVPFCFHILIAECFWYFLWSNLNRRL